MKRFIGGLPEKVKILKLRSTVFLQIKPRNFEYTIRINTSTLAIAKNDFPRFSGHFSLSKGLM